MTAKKMVYCREGTKITEKQYMLLSSINGCAHFASDSCDCECHGRQKTNKAKKFRFEKKTGVIA